MEEVIGKVWDKFIVKRVSKSYENEKVFFLVTIFPWDLVKQAVL